MNPGGAALAGAGYLSAPFSDPFGTGADPLATWQGVAGDFNGDGVPDLLIYSTDSISNTLLLHVFEGVTAQFVALPKQSFPFSPQSYPSGPAVLDVDGDGKLDLLIGNTVAYGNGDGTFSRVAVLPMLATGFNQSYAVDVNGDGKLDIVAVNTPPRAVDTPGNAQFTFTVFRNNGDGTFTSLGVFPLAAPVQTGVGMCCVMYNIFGLSFGDIDGDGKIDVLSQSNGVPDGNGAAPDQFNVMLNNGDGTFGAPKSIDTSVLRTLQSTAVAFGDVNGDRKNDLVLAYADNQGTNYLGAALGNGDGTFGSFFQLKLIDFVTEGITNPQVQLIDFNVDGKLDAILGSGELALGNGDGTFALSTPLFPQPADPQIPLNYPLLQIPIYTITLPSLVYLDFTNAKAVFTPLVSSSASFTPVLSAGDHTITVHYSGDSTYAAGVSAPAIITVTSSAPPPTIAVTSSANPINASQPVTFTATLSDPTITGAITFVDISKNDDDPLDPMAGTSESTLGTGTIANGVATLTTKLLVGGAHTILAVYGPDIYAPIAQAQLTEMVNLPFAVDLSDTGVSLTASSGQTATATLPVQALGGFTGQVTFACQGTPTCNFSPATVNLSGTGTVNVTLTVTAVAVTATNTADTRLRSMALACGLPLFALLGFAGRGRRRILLLVFGAALCVVPFTGCGGGGSSSSASSNGLQAGTYPFYITATSGQNVQVLQGMLTVR